MIDMVACQLALRSRALAAVACTTGTTSLGATGRTFTRAAGSFVTDGFAVGMEATPSGFSAANNAPAVIVGVSAGVLTVDRDLGTQSAAGGRSLTVGVPALRALDNVAFNPVAGRPYYREEFVPATRRAVTYGGTNNLEEEAGLYVAKLYGLAGKGITAARRVAQAVVEAFPIADTLDAGAGLVTIRGNPAPWADSVRPLDTGHALVVVTIPWRAYSRPA